ncbi:MAG TPA: alpha/beta hydrolase-fold protein [Steroidobacteraceae bacterium]|nr:alpha/beta hydrolase-fold protein [Steroidobacteraceae bacterium]
MFVLAVLLAPLARASDSGGDSTPAPDPESPRLRALAAALDAHDPTALDTFWNFVAQHGTPLIEEVPGRPQDVRYTFLWRTEPGQVALNVRFNGWFPLHTPRGFDTFTQLRKSTVWYTSYVLDRTAHLRYELISPKGWHASPDRATYFTMDDAEYETFHDPLNPRLSHWNNVEVSYAEGPDATTSVYLEKRPGVAAGTLDELDVESHILGNRRTLRIYLPPGYHKSTQDYGLLLAYDGNQYTQSVPTPMILDNMIAAHAIAPVVAVFLESPDRDHEFPPNDAFQRFVGEELLPQLRKHYRLSRDPRRNAVLGSSYGGLAATYTAFKHPSVFGNVISQSGSYGWSPEAAANNFPSNFGRIANPDSGWLTRQIAEAPHLSVRFYLDAGTWEGPNMLASNRMLRSVLVGKGCTVVYREAPGTHSAYYWMLRLPDGLRATLGQR